MAAFFDATPPEVGDADVAPPALLVKRYLTPLKGEGETSGGVGEVTFPVNDLSEEEVRCRMREACVSFLAKAWADSCDSACPNGRYD